MNETRIPVPIVDPVSAAVKQAEALVALAPRKAVSEFFPATGSQDHDRPRSVACCAYPNIGTRSTMICSETGRVILGGILYDVVHD